MIKTAFAASLFLAMTIVTSAAAAVPVSGAACAPLRASTLVVECGPNYSFRETFTCLPGSRSGYLMWVVTGLTEGAACAPAAPAKPVPSACPGACVDKGYYNGYRHCYSYFCKGIEQPDPRCLGLQKPDNECPKPR